MRHGIDNIDFHGLEALRLQTSSGASAVISLYGAQLLSWITPDRRERFYLSEKARYDMQHPVRGGVPISFPQFSNLGPLPKHGFLRQHLWTVTTRNEGDGYLMVTLACRDDDATRRIWPHAFQAELSVALDEERLDIELDIENIGDESFSFTAALHTYLHVDEVENVAVEGLYGLEYRDAADGNSIKKDNGPTLHVSDPVDRVYHDIVRQIVLRDGDHAVGIGSEGFRDAVVWNPWEEATAKMADMQPRDFRHMLCIEAAAAREPVQLAPGEDWWGRQTLIAM